MRRFFAMIVLAMIVGVPGLAAQHPDDLITRAERSTTTKDLAELWDGWTHQKVVFPPSWPKGGASLAWQRDPSTAKQQTPRRNWVKQRAQEVDTTFTKKAPSLRDSLPRQEAAVVKTVRGQKDPAKATKGQAITHSWIED